MAQIDSVTFVSTPKGGPATPGNTVYIIGNEVQIAVNYADGSDPLPSNVGTPTLGIRIGAEAVANHREARCARAADRRLLCTYVIAEGDSASSDDGITVRANALSSSVSLPGTQYSGTPNQGTEVDGVRLKLTRVEVSGRGSNPGFTVGNTVALTLTFGQDGEAVTNSGTFGASLVLENGERAARFVETAGRTVKFSYAVVAGDNAKAFGLNLTGGDALKDKNGNAGLAKDPGVKAALAAITASADRRIDTRAPHVTQILASAATAIVKSGNITFEVFLSEVVGTHDGVTLRVTVGTKIVSTNTCTGDAAEKLTCVLPIAENSGLLDTDGVSTPANPLNFNYIRDNVGNNIAPAFGTRTFPKVKVDTVQPTVTSASISSVTPETNRPVVVRLTFSEDVKIGNTKPSVSVNVGSESRPATYLSRSGKTVTFRYLLVEGDVSGYNADNSAANRVVVKLTTFAAGDLTDLAGNAPVTTVTETTAAKTGTTFTKKQNFADRTSPTLQSITLGGTVPENRVYGSADDTLTFQVTFSEKVTVTTVKVQFRVGSSGVLTTSDITGSDDKWTGTYGLSTPAGLGGAIRVTGLVLADGGQILDMGGANNQRGWRNGAIDPGDTNRITRRTTISPNRSLTGSASVDRVAPKVKTVELLTNPAPGSVGRDGQKYYGEDEIIRIKVTMDEDVSIPATADTKPSLNVRPGNTGDAAFNGTAEFKLLQGGRTLFFEYKVVGSGCANINPTSGSTCHIARNGISVTGITNQDAIDDAGRNSCSEGTCGYTLWNGTLSARHGVDGSLSGNQTVSPITGPPAQETVNPVRPQAAVRSQTPSGGFYKSGDTITIEVTLDPEVTFTEAPQLVLNLDEGGSRRLRATGSFSSTGTPRRTLSFQYDVVNGDEDVDGFTGSLTCGGTLTVESGQTVNCGGITISSATKIDARAPELESLTITSSAGADGTYTVGDSIEVTAEFSEDVRRTSTGAEPTVPIDVGGITRTATLQSPSATAADDTYVFRYTVAAGDNDPDGVTIAANALVASLADLAGNASSITHSAVEANTAHKVDTRGPSVVAVDISGANEDGLFVEGSTITAAVTFDEQVDVTISGSNAVRVRFLIGTVEHTGAYRTGDDSTTLTFTYEVQAGDSGPLSVPANAIVGDVEDAAGNPAGPTPAVPVTPYRVDASAPMLVGAPSITSQPANGDTYVQGEIISFQVRFDEPVEVDGEPRLPIMVGERPRNRVLFNNGSGTDTLTFVYTVQAGDMDDNGVSVPRNSLRLTSGATIKDVNGLSVASENGTVMHAALPDQSGHKVDAVAPGVESLAITSNPASGDAYLIGETIAVTVSFSEDVSVSGSPMLGIVVGTGSREASCAQGTDRAAMVCSYTVVANDFDANGVSVNADSISGTITDTPGNAADLTHAGLEDDPAHKVYAARPEVVGRIQPLSMAAGGATNSIDLAEAGVFTGFQLTFSAVSDNTAVATASVSGSLLSVQSGMEGTATVTVTATNLAGSVDTSFGVTVATDPVETAVLNDALAAIGRSMLSSTASVIGSRFELAATGAQMALGGSRFGGSMSAEMQRLMAGGDPFAMQARMEERALFDGSAGAVGFDRGYGLTADRLLSGTSFNMPLNALGTGGMTSFAIWGAGDLASFEGEPDNGMYDGSSSAGFIGVDARGDGWLAGVSVSRSGAEADYDFDGIVQGETGGTLETAVTAFHPYARLEVGPDSEVWVIGGFGGGEADLSRTHVAGAQSSDLSMAMAVGGLRRALAMEFGGADLSLRGDAGFLSLETDSGMQAIDGLSASVSRLRLGLEAAWDIETMTPFVEVSGRFDGGDGQTGGGLELAGGIRILNAESGFGLEAKGRVLAMHTGEGYSESGIGVTASFEPGGGTGITFRLSPRWGGSADSTDLFWDEVGTVNDPSRYAYGLNRPQTWGMDAALGYSFGLRSVPGLVTPFTQLDVTGDQDQRIRVGVRYGLMQSLLGGTQVEVSAERVDGEMYRNAETRMLVTGRARF